MGGNFLRVFLFINIMIFGETARYQFILENDQVFDSCPQIPGNNGIFDIFDLSEITFDYRDGIVHVSGNATIIIEDVQSTDRIEARTEVFKFKQGNWQPTTISCYTEDFCPKQFDTLSPWYQLWTKYIPKDEQFCINNVGLTYHHQPFIVDTTFEFFVNVEGRYKIIIQLLAYDTNNVKREKLFCLQIYGEFVKVKTL